jgi:membrane-bound inhibitor of C-type lysozyme
MERSLEVKALPMIGSVLAWGLISAQASVASPQQPPMNNFDFAFYTCAEGGAFQISYDSDTPTKATLTTSLNNTQYELVRAPVDQGVQFSKGAVKFWTDGKTVVVDGTKARFKDCKRKGQ